MQEDENDLKNQEKIIRKIRIPNLIYLQINKFLKKIFLLFKLDIKRKRPTFDDIYIKYLKEKIIIFDVGANCGQSLIRFKNYFPKSIIHAFEPVKECFNILQTNFKNPKIILNNYALGDTFSKKNFNINKLSYTSSFLKNNSSYKEKHLYEKKKTIKQKIIKLDDYIKKKGIKKIDILKIDTQGYELRVLKGASENLKKNIIKFIEIEIILGNSYLGKPSFSKIDSFLSKNNYSLYALNEFVINEENGQLEFFDALYKKTNLKL